MRENSKHYPGIEPSTFGVTVGCVVAYTTEPFRPLHVEKLFEKVRVTTRVKRKIRKSTRPVVSKEAYTHKK
jgi:hypothetical protein